jgi:hypothetical protein
LEALEMERPRSAPPAELAGPNATWRFVGVRVGLGLHDAITARARIEDATSSAIVRRALRAYLSHPAGDFGSARDN